MTIHEVGEELMCNRVVVATLPFTVDGFELEFTLSVNYEDFKEAKITLQSIGPTLGLDSV